MFPNRSEGAWTPPVTSLRKTSSWTPLLVEDDAAAREEGVPVRYAWRSSRPAATGARTWHWCSSSSPQDSNAASSPRGGTVAPATLTAHARRGPRLTNMRQTSPRGHPPKQYARPRPPGGDPALRDSPGTFKSFTEVCTAPIKRSPLPTCLFLSRYRPESGVTTAPELRQSRDLSRLKCAQVLEAKSGDTEHVHELYNYKYAETSFGLPLLNLLFVPEIK